MDIEILQFRSAWLKTNFKILQRLHSVQTKEINANRGAGKVREEQLALEGSLIEI